MHVYAHIHKSLKQTHISPQEAQTNTQFIHSTPYPQRTTSSVLAAVGYTRNSAVTTSNPAWFRTA